MTHADTGMSSTIAGDEASRIIKCSCGWWIPRDRFDAHVAANPVLEARGYTLRREGTTFLVEPTRRAGAF